MLIRRLLIIWGLLIGNYTNAMQSKPLVMSHDAHCVCAKTVTGILLSTSNQSASIKIQEHPKTALVTKPVYYPSQRPALAERTELRISGFSEHGVIAGPDDTIIPADYNYKVADVEWKHDKLKLKIKSDMNCYIKASQSQFGEPVLSLHVVPKFGMAYHRIDVSAIGGLLHSAITCKEPVLEGSNTITVKYKYELHLE